MEKVVQNGDGLDTTIFDGSYAGRPITDIPYIDGLLRDLPERGNVWPRDERVRWLQTATKIFDLIYQAKGRIEIK